MAMMMMIELEGEAGYTTPKRMMKEEETGYSTPKRRQYRIPEPSLPPPPPKKKPYFVGEKKPEPPKDGYFNSPDIEVFFAAMTRSLA